MDAEKSERHLPAPTPLERIAGSPAVEAGLTAVAAFAGAAVSGGAAAVLAPLVPVLAKSLAAERQKLRVEGTLMAIARDLDLLEAQVHALTDGQYKLVSETVLAVMQTTDQTKLAYLRAVVRNVAAGVDIPSDEAAMLSRVVRDISGAEIAFLTANFAYETVVISKDPLASSNPLAVGRPSTLDVRPDSHESLLVLGLVGLGILYTPSETGWGVTGMRFSRIAPKLIALLTPGAG